MKYICGECSKSIDEKNVFKVDRGISGDDYYCNEKCIKKRDNRVKKYVRLSVVLAVVFLLLLIFLK